MYSRGFFSTIVIAITLVCGCSEPDTDRASESSKAGSDSTAVVRHTDTLSTDATEFQFEPLPKSTTSSTFNGSTPKFRDVSVSRGLVHTYENGATGQLLMVESIGGGVAWLDLDADGFPDAYMVQAGSPNGPVTQRPHDRIFRNRESGFVDVTTMTGIHEQGYGQGVAVGDYDADGFDDIYVTNVGANTLYHNNGDGTVSEVTATSGTQDDRWSSSAAWADINADALPELYVCNYLKYDPYDPFPCEKDGKPALCHPRQIDAWPDELFLNRGDGSFEAAAEKMGTVGPGNKGLGVAVAHFNDDDLPDIYVCNDTTSNFLFVNSGEGFRERALDLGVALNSSGDAEASMGVEVGDSDGDGRLDLFLTHFTNESNTMYQNIGPAGFRDVTNTVGLHSVTMPKLGFGVVMRDFNSDSHPDIFIANGHIDHNNADGDGFEQHPQVLTTQNETWFDVSEEAGPYFRERRVARGVAVADFDCDGDWDLLTGNQNAPAALLMNESRHGHWLKIRFIGIASERRGSCTRVTLEFGKVMHTMELTAGTSFASSHEPIVICGFGDTNQSGTVSITWTSGVQQVIHDVQPDQSLIVLEGRPPYSDPTASHRPLDTVSQ